MNIDEFLAHFLEHRGRTLQTRARRHLGDIITLLSEFLHDRGVKVIARVPRGEGAVSLSGALRWIDVFESSELLEVFDGDREKLRVADGAIRALTRRLSAELG